VENTTFTEPFCSNASLVSAVANASLVLGFPMMYFASICESPASKPVSLPVIGSRSENRGVWSLPATISTPAARIFAISLPGGMSAALATGAESMSC
jgi:hypothetical protein